VATRGFGAPFILIGIFLLLFVAGGAYYLGKSGFSVPTPTSLPSGGSNPPVLSPTTDPTAGWKIYTNKKMGFEFKYPNFYSDVTSKGFPGLGLRQNLNYIAQFENHGDNSSFFILSDLSPFSLDNLKEFAPTGSELIPPVTKQIGNLTFYYYGPGGGGVRYPDQYFINLNNTILEFSFNGPYDNDKTPSESAKELELNILSTFKFFDQNGSTTNWKTYTNSTYGFSLEYPTNYVFLEASPEYVRFFKGPWDQGMPTPETYLSLQVKDNTQKLTLQEWMQKNVDVANHEPFPKGVEYLSLSSSKILQITPLTHVGQYYDQETENMAQQIVSTLQLPK
jgi:hypothetical protein